MNPLLIAALQCVAAAGHEVNDVRRLDVQGNLTVVGITWSDTPGMVRYMEGFDGSGERPVAVSILHDLLMREAP